MGMGRRHGGGEGYTCTLVSRLESEKRYGILKSATVVWFTD